jgi:hypothetical protein
MTLIRQHRGHLSSIDAAGDFAEVGSAIELRITAVGEYLPDRPARLGRLAGSMSAIFPNGCDCLDNAFSFINSASGTVLDVLWPDKILTLIEGTSFCGSPATFYNAHSSGKRAFEKQVTYGENIM